MNYLSVFIDFSVSALCFICCFVAGAILRRVFFALGLKSIIYAAVNFFLPKKPSSPSRKRRRKKPVPVRSVEINPDEVDRIYVRKIS